MFAGEVPTPDMGWRAWNTNDAWFNSPSALESSRPEANLILREVARDVVDEHGQSGDLAAK